MDSKPVFPAHKQYKAARFLDGERSGKRQAKPKGTLGKKHF